MAFIENVGTSGAVVAALTRIGKLTLLKNGNLNITQFALLDGEINYQLLHPDNIDQENSDILAQAIIEPSTNEDSGDYDFDGPDSGGCLLNQPYFFQSSTVLTGNRIMDNPFFVHNQQIITDMPSLSGDPMSVFPPSLPATGNIVSVNTFYSVTVIVVDANGSVINGTIANLYSNNGFIQANTINNNTQTVFPNLSASQDYKILVQNPTYSFSETTSGGPAYKITSLNNNTTIKFIGTLQTPVSNTLVLSGNITSGITTSALSGIIVNFHYGNTTLTASSDNSGSYSFATLSSNTQFSLNINNNGYYYDNHSTAISGVLTANTVKNFILYPISKISGKVYYYGTTSPISNAVVNLNKGATSDINAAYLSSVASDQFGNFTFQNVILKNDYNIQAVLGGFTFVNTPYNISSSTVTGCITGIILYGKKAQRPVIYDSPFPLRRRILVEDNSEFPVFYDPCSWVLYSSKYATLGYAAKFSYSPIYHVNVLTSTNYTNLINTLSGPFEFQWNTKKSFNDTFGNISYTNYISDSYTIKISLYVLPYKYSIPPSIPQWDEFSQDEGHSIFPAEVNNVAQDIILIPGSTNQFIDLVPDISNQQLAINLQNANNISALVPNIQTVVPLTLNNANSIPQLGLLAAQAFDINSSILNVALTPTELAQNSDYTSYASVTGPERRIPIEVTVDDFQETTTNSLQNVTNNTTYNILGVPLPFFVPSDISAKGIYLTNNLRWQFGISNFTDQLRSTGYIFNRVINWVNNNGSYILGKESSYITIFAVGSTMTVDQIFFTADASHYSISDEFKQFIISYFGVNTQDTVTITNLFQGKTLTDWLFYMLLIQYGTYKNIYVSGNISTLWTISKETKYGLIIDLIIQGKTTTDIVSDLTNRQYQPSSTTLAYFQSLNQTIANSSNLGVKIVSNASNIQSQLGSTTNNILQQQSVINNPSSTLGNSTSTINNSSKILSDVGSSPNVSNLLPTSPGASLNTASNATINSTNNLLGNSVTNSNLNNPLSTAQQSQQTIIPPKVSDNKINEYIIFSKAIVTAWTSFAINKAIIEVYGLVQFDFRVSYVIVIQTLGVTTVVNSVKIPIKKLTVVTQSINPVIQRLIRISNANNYFNLNSSLEQKLKLTLSFDLTQPGTVDNFIRAINYLNARLYTVYLGVEIIDDGQITQGYNSQVQLLPQYINAGVEIQQAFCKSDKVQWLIPLTLGGVTTVGTTSVTQGDPTTFIGTGFIKLIPFIDQNNKATNIAHLVRIIRLSDTAAANTNLVNINQLTGGDYITFQVLRITNFSNFDFTKIIRFLQILDKYSYNTMNTDVQNLRQVLKTTYTNIPNISFVGDFGPGFSNSTIGPILWDSTYIQWPQGATPISILTSLLSQSGKIIDIGQIITTINQFTAVNLITPQA